MLRLPTASPPVVQPSVPTLPVASAAPGGGGRSPGLILLVATLALVFISVQSLSEISDVLLRHVDDALLEDGTLFASINLDATDVDIMTDYDEDDGNRTTPHSTEAKGDAMNVLKSMTDREPKKPIILELGFVTLKDRYFLAQSGFNRTEEDLIIAKCVKLWQDLARIQLNFTRLDNTPLSEAQADAYRWFVFGSKDQTKQQKFWKDVNTFMRKGPSKLSAVQTGEIIAKYFQYSGYPLLDWITSAGKNITLPPRDFDVVPIHYWPWKNGGTLGGRVILRGGSCGVLMGSREEKKTKKTDLLVCNGWAKSARDAPKLSAEQAGRILAHLIGRRLGLRHPSKAQCEDAGHRLLMCPVALHTDHAAMSVDDVKLTENEINLARLYALGLISKRKAS